MRDQLLITDTSAIASCIQKLFPETLSMLKDEKSSFRFYILNSYKISKYCAFLPAANV